MTFTLFLCARIPTLWPPSIYVTLSRGMQAVHPYSVFFTTAFIFVNLNQLIDSCVWLISVTPTPNFCCPTPSLWDHIPHTHSSRSAAGSLFHKALTSKSSCLTTKLFTPRAVLTSLICCTPTSHLEASITPNFFKFHRTQRGGGFVPHTLQLTPTRQPWMLKPSKFHLFCIGFILLVPTNLLPTSLLCRFSFVISSRPHLRWEKHPTYSLRTLHLVEVRTA